MAFADYLDLRTAVIEQVGDASVVDVFDRLTKLAEVYLTRNLRMSQQLSETDLVVSGGVASLPDDFAETFGVYDRNGYEINQQTLQDLQGDTSRDGTYTLQYYAKIPTLTGAPTNSNWLLEAHPDVYLYSVAYEAAKHLRDTESAQAFMALREDAVFDARGSDHRTRYSRTRVRVKGCTP